MVQPNAAITEAEGTAGVEIQDIMVKEDPSAGTKPAPPKAGVVEVEHVQMQKGHGHIGAAKDTDTVEPTRRLRSDAAAGNGAVNSRYGMRDPTRAMLPNELAPTALVLNVAKHLRNIFPGMTATTSGEQRGADAGP
jgi:hypothetical protein